MTANAWVFTDAAKAKILNGTFDWDTDSFKCALVTSASNIGTGSTTWAGVTGEVANGNGYTTGGVAVAFTITGTAPVKVDITTDPVWNATGSGITCRTAVIYEVGGDVACYSLLDNTPADVVVAAGNPLTVAAHATNGLFTMAFA